MSLTPNAQRRRAFLFGRQHALRLTSDAFSQLAAQLHTEREQHAFDISEFEKEKAMLLRDLTRTQYELAQARFELAKRDLVDAFANAPSPSAMMH